LCDTDQFQDGHSLV